MSFSFGFAGDDIDDTGAEKSTPQIEQKPLNRTPAASAFPVPGKPQLPPTHHPLPSLLSQLPSKVAFSCLDVSLDDGSSVKIPRRELWDVRIQLMAEDDGKGGLEGLGEHDVKTGVYEGGFKSWESSVDLVKVLASMGDLSGQGERPLRIIEVCHLASKIVIRVAYMALRTWAYKTNSSAAGRLSRHWPCFNGPSDKRKLWQANFLSSLRITTLLSCSS